MLAAVSKCSTLVGRSFTRAKGKTLKTSPKFDSQAVLRPARLIGFGSNKSTLNCSYKRLYTVKHVSVPERDSETYGGPADETHYADEIEKACRRGVGFKESGNYEDALKEFTRAIEMSDETNYRAFSLRGDLNQTLGRLTEALSDYNRVLKFLPTHIPTLTSQASVYKLMGDYEKAKAQFTYILGFEGTYAPAWIGKAECHAQLGEHAEAVKSYQKALDWKDRWIPEASVYEALGDSLVMTNNVEKALEAYKASLSISPEVASCHGAHGVALYLARQFPEATDAFTLALKYGGTPKEELLVKRASCYLQFENIDKAMADCTEALAYQPSFYKARLIRAQCYQERLQLQNAVEDYDAFLSDVEKHLQQSAKESPEAMSAQWHQLATVRVRRAQCHLELWMRELHAEGKEVPKLAAPEPPKLSQSELVAKFESMNQTILSMGPTMAPRLKLAFSDLVEARRLEMAQPEVPILLDILGRILEYKFKGPKNIFT
jgi:tetratricopeptide (TPR) repeat protein